MSRPDFVALRQDLQRAGIAPALISRTVLELNDHYDDLVEAALDEGHGQNQAERLATTRIGAIDGLVEAAKARPELRSWAWRWPKVALVIYPLACVAALPAVPVIAGVQNATLLARWAACLVLSGLVTAFMFLVLQLSITLT